TSDLPGHRALHDRVCAALDRCMESQGVEFKQSSPWDDLRFKIIKTSIAMGNLRDGGIIIIGASENGDHWDLSGISEEHLATYDVDIVIDFINSFSSPAMEPELVLVRYQNRNIFLTIQIAEFENTPYVCRRNGPDGSGLKEGILYLRKAGIASTSQVTSATDMHDLLELAAEKRARNIIQTGQRIGLIGGLTAETSYNRELDGL
ncbi:MAG: ATP-binding protein, partial [Bacteroidota bacterium]